MGAIAVLAACGSKSGTLVEPTASTAANQTAIARMAGEYEVKLADGPATTRMINADGTYSTGREVLGTWRMNGAQICFDPEGVPQEICYTTSAPAADGTFMVSTLDGKVVATLRKVAAPPAP